MKINIIHYTGKTWHQLTIEFNSKILQMLNSKLLSVIIVNKQKRKQIQNKTRNKIILNLDHKKIKKIIIEMLIKNSWDTKQVNIENLANYPDVFDFLLLHSGPYDEKDIILGFSSKKVLCESLLGPSSFSFFSIYCGNVHIVQ